RRAVGAARGSRQRRPLARAAAARPAGRDRGRGGPGGTPRAAPARGWAAARGAALTRLLAPEVIQSSAMDCGPAALCSLLAGHGIQVSYGRLREACQTSVDGTSIDTLEEVAVQLGLAAEQ